MAAILYSIYAVVTLVVAVGGILGVTFGTPDLEEGSGYLLEALTILAAIFLLAMVAGFVI